MIRRGFKIGQAAICSPSLSTMNRPRNRQARPPRSHQQDGAARTRVPGRTNIDVPSSRQVVPGAAVSIVLKADQSTGREVQGTVQDLLSRGDHPRGIKVRLQDGRIGRVQRMADEVPLHPGSGITSTSGPGISSPAERSDRRSHGAALPGEAPPPRSLADFIPALNGDRTASSTQPGGTEFVTATAKCPFCHFQGDELAVSHHVEEHLG